MQLLITAGKREASPEKLNGNIKFEGEIKYNIRINYPSSVKQCLLLKENKISESQEDFTTNLLLALLILKPISKSIASTVCVIGII